MVGSDTLGMSAGASIENEMSTVPPGGNGAGSNVAASRSAVVVGPGASSHAVAGHAGWSRNRSSVQTLPDV